MPSLPEIGCVTDVTPGRGQAQGGTEDATSQHPVLAGAQLRLPLRGTSWISPESQ